MKLPVAEQGADLVAGEDVPVSPGNLKIRIISLQFSSCTVPIAFGHGKPVGVGIVGQDVVCAAFVGGVHGEAQGSFALLRVGELYRRELWVRL